MVGEDLQAQSGAGLEHPSQCLLQGRGSVWPEGVNREETQSDHSHSPVASDKHPTCFS